MKNSMESAWEIAGKARKIKHDKNKRAKIRKAVLYCEMRKTY